MKNLVILIGRVGKDPEVRHLDNGKSVANFSLATSQSYKNKQGEKVENTEWHSIVAWSPLADIIEKYINKGALIYLEGKIQTRSYEKDGDKKYITEIALRELKMLGGTKDAKKEPAKQEQKAEEVYVDETDDLPF